MRFLAAAATPIKTSWLLRALIMHIRGKGSREFEEALKIYFRKSGAYTFSSLMRTNYACLMAMKLATNCTKNMVILPRYSCPSFIHAVIAAGLRPMYCDINPETLSIDMNSINSMDTKDVLALVCTNLFGLSGKAAEIRKFCDERGIFMIEGADYSLGSIYDGKLVGTEADFTILNFQEGKALPVGGGAIVTNHSSIMDLLDIGHKANSSNILTLFAYRFAITPFFYWIFMKIAAFIGFNRKKLTMEDTMRNASGEFDFYFDRSSAFLPISNFQAYLGLCILNEIDGYINKREGMALQIEEKLSDISILRLTRREEKLSKTHYIRYPVLVRQDIRAGLLKSLLNNGIEASPMYIEHGMSFEASDFPGAYTVLYELLTLPCHPYVKQKDVNAMYKVFKRFEECKN